MRHDDLDERLRKLGVNVGPFTFTVVFLIGVALRSELVGSCINGRRRSASSRWRIG